MSIRTRYLKMTVFLRLHFFLANNWAWTTPRNLQHITISNQTFMGGIINTTSNSLAFYHSKCPKNLFQVHTTNMFPQSTSVFTPAVTKLTKKRVWLQINNIICGSNCYCYNCKFFSPPPFSPAHFVSSKFIFLYIWIYLTKV